MKTKMVYVPKTVGGYLKGFHRMTEAQEREMLSLVGGKAAPEPPDHIEPKRSSRYDSDYGEEIPVKPRGWSSGFPNLGPRERTAEELKRAEAARRREVTPEPIRTPPSLESTRDRALLKARSAGATIKEVGGRVLLEGKDVGSSRDRKTWSKVIVTCTDIHRDKIRELRKANRDK